MLDELDAQHRDRHSERWFQTRSTMKVLTPIFPHQNSTFNVSEASLSVIKKKMNEGLAIVNDILAGRALWDDFFEEKKSFFDEYT